MNCKLIFMSFRTTFLTGSILCMQPVYTIRQCYQTFLFEIEKDVNGLHTLLKGFLPVEFVSRTLLKCILIDIESELLKSNMSTRLTHNKPEYHYHLSDSRHKKQYSYQNSVNVGGGFI